MDRPASPFLRIGKHALVGLTAAAWLTGLGLVLDRIGARSGLFRGFSAAMLGDVAMTLGLFGLIGAVLIANARRIEQDGASRLAWALVGVLAAVAGCSGFGLSGVVASVMFDAPGRQTFANEMVAASVFPLLATLCIAGFAGAWASVAAAPPAWGLVRKTLLRTLCGATGLATALVAVAIARASGPGSGAVGAPMLATLAALTVALALRARKPSTAGELVGALAGYVFGAVGGLVASGCIDAWTSAYDPRARFLGVIFMWPILLATLMVTGVAAVTIAGSVRETFGRVRRAFA